MVLLSNGAFLLDFKMDLISNCFLSDSPGLLKKLPTNGDLRRLSLLLRISVFTNT